MTWAEFKERYPDTSRLMVIQAALLITVVLFSAAAELTVSIIRNIYAYHSKPRIELVAPPAPACKICHCGQVSCHRDCGEQNMCNLKCEGLCRKQK